VEAGAVPSEYIDVTTEAALEEKAKLRRHFGRFDILFFLICTIVGLDTLGAVASNGAEGFTWLIFLSVFFFVPYALLTAELGAAFPEEGGCYEWMKLAFGRFTAGVNSVIYWLSNPIWLGGVLAITALTTFSTFFTNIDSTSSVWRYIFLLGFIWFAVWGAILSFNIGKWIPSIGAFARVALLSFFSISVLIYAIKHGVHGFGAGSFKPTYAIFIAAVPVLFFNFVGFELPNAAGEEMINAKRDVPFTIIRAAAASILLYGVPVLMILLVLPTGQVTNLGGFIDAMKTVFTVYGGSVAADGTANLTGAGHVLGDIAAIGFIWVLMSSGATWIMGADRTQAVAGYDGAAPRLFGVFSKRWGTPIVVNLTSGVVATFVMVLASLLTSGSSQKYFSAVLGLAISTTTISYILIFPTVIKLRYSHGHVPRPFKIPGGMVIVWVVGVLCTAWALLATVVLLWPGLGTSNPNGALDGLGFSHQRWQYEAAEFIPLAVILALGVIFYALGAPTRRRTATLPLVEPEPAPA
jgi:glutamate:GABA antiporter